MNQSKLLVSALAGLAILAVAGSGSPARADARAEIRALEDRFVAAFKAKDPDAIMKVYVPDESLFVFDAGPRGHRQFVGAAAYRKEWQQFLDGFAGPITVEFSDFALTVDHTLAYGHSIQRVAGTDKQGKAIDVTACVTDVYKKIKRHWLIVHEHVSMPVDLDTGKPDLSSKP